MKRKSSKFLCSLVALIMVLASTGTAFAAGNDVKTAEPAGAVLELIQESVENAQLQASGRFVVNTPVTGDEPLAEPELILYGISDTALSGNYRGYAQAVNFASKGVLDMTVYAVSDNGGGSVYYGLFYDAALTNPVGYSSTTAYSASTEVVEENFSNKRIAVPAAGTYYLGVYSSISETSTNQNYMVMPIITFYNGGNRALSSNTWSAVGTVDTGLTYLSFKATKNGYVTVSSEYLTGYVTLTNASKKAISNDVYVSSTYPETVFGVKKGKTYYLAVKSNYTGDAYKLKYKQTAITEKSGAKKAKAVSVKKGKTVKGTITAGENKADWYKFTVTKTKKVKINIGGDTNDQIKVVVYDGNRNMGSTTLYYYSGQKTLESIGKLSKGTYHIKVYRGNSKSSGYYTLKWK